MTTLSTALRPRIERNVSDARDTAETGARAVLERRAVREPYEHMTPEQQAQRRWLHAHDLQTQLEKILVGEPPCDLFIRWKPLHQQPIGWEPDLDDGVRLNIRPFLSAELRKGGRRGAGLLRSKPNIKWSKDRGREPLKPGKRRKPPWLQDEEGETEVNEAFELRPRRDYPWFWGCPGEGTLIERINFPGGPDFDGNRWNDLHYTNAAKRAARERSTAGP